MTFLKKLLLVSAVGSLIATPALAQSGAFPNYPIVGGSSYSCGTTNGVQTCTVPAGPTALTGRENIPANTNLSGGRTPQNVLLTPAVLGALPATILDAASVTVLSADNYTGGVIFHHTGGITAAGVTLPTTPIDNQTFFISANRTITTLTVTPGGSTTIAANSRPTVLTASTIGPQSYKFLYNLSGNIWYRLQ